MPGDFSMCLCLSPPPPPQFCRPSTGTLRPCLAPFPRPPDPRKKGVVFADALGLALTSVRHISRPFFDEDPLVIALASLRALRPFSTSTYTLDFQPPAHDYSSFRARLAQQHVCLEQCAVQGAAVAGTVQVHNLGYQKRVTLRVSYDNWKSHYDLPCSYLRDPYGGGETDMFSFRLPLPPGTQRAEFCICFWCQGEEHWDSNGGKNYALHKEGEHSRYLHNMYW
ncbi:PREDICTED: protein phosphatase 1 regulatory subunit 3C-like [Nanorana parkeri]|uniref:protein phosphatase 1 regulatory subunit 3C-like n=1 Tax=Nanorana parkeri TaxID=125878 RepID=UPI0008541ADA|nr:PREDICTED: protein phosphatase 1 regulatory subunit 3C-like [Nanorana parkeri]